MGLCTRGRPSRRAPHGQGRYALRHCGPSKYKRCTMGHRALLHTRYTPHEAPSYLDCYDLTRWNCHAPRARTAQDSTRVAKHLRHDRAPSVLVLGCASSLPVNTTRLTWTVVPASFETLAAVRRRGSCAAAMLHFLDGLWLPNNAKHTSSSQHCDGYPGAPPQGNIRRDKRSLSIPCLYSSRSRQHGASMSLMNRGSWVMRNICTSFEVAAARRVHVGL